MKLNKWIKCIIIEVVGLSVAAGAMSATNWDVGSGLGLFGVITGGIVTGFGIIQLWLDKLN